MSFLNTIIFEAKRFAPSIFAGAGMMTIGISCYEACKASYVHLDDIFEGHKAAMKDVREEEDDKTRGRDTFAIYKRTCCSLAKLYALPVLGLALGMGFMLEGQAILDQRLTAATAAATSIQTAFEEYRQRLIEDQGEEADLKYRTGAKEVVEKKTIVDEDGKKKKVKEKYLVMDPRAKGTGFARYITKDNPYWNDDPYMMDTMFELEQSYLNELLRINDQVIVQQVDDRFNIVHDEPVPENMVWGWIKGQSIDLNWMRVKLPTADGEYEDAYMIDPNVQCNVYTTLRRQKALTTTAPEPLEEVA